MLSTMSEGWRAARNVLLPAAFRLLGNIEDENTLRIVLPTGGTAYQGLGSSEGTEVGARWRRNLGPTKGSN